MIKPADLQMHWAASIAAGIVLYCITGVVYRLYLSPLAKFPGPKLAAATLWYEAYYDVIKKGQYTLKIRELHVQYGPIIRISPYELHINDPDYHEHLFSRSSPRNKYKYFTDQFGIPKSSFSAIDHNLHRLRRQPQNPFFSKQSILRLESTIFVIIEKLCARIDGFKMSGLPVPVQLAYRCLTTDIVTLYSMNRSWDYLDSADFSPLWFQTIKATGEIGHILKQLPWLLPLFQSLPDWVISKLYPDMLLVLEWQRSMGRHIQRVIDEKEHRHERQEGDTPSTIFHTLLESNLPDEEKSLERLWQEAMLIVGAGTDTTGNALTVTTFHLISNPDKLAKLRKELEAAIPNRFQPAKLIVVEKLPYLSAVVQEGLRLSYGTATRLQRIAPNENLQYQEFSIPAGTPVGMTSVIMHHNESVFPNSYDFIPERWTNPDSGRALERYMIAFSRGSRQCLGMNLAKAELYLTLATIVRRYDMELFDTIRERDVDFAYDGFLPQPSPQSKGVRVLFK